VLIPRWIPVVFCISGFAALLYQVVWERVLYSTFGVTVEAVTTVVSAFLAGLGLGSLLGGRLARGSSSTLLLLCSFLEITIGVFGLWSAGFFRWIGRLTVDFSSVPRAAVMAMAVMVPTTLMGATLPLLVSYLVPSTGNVGRTVGVLYFINTAGSAFAALAAVLLLLGQLGENSSVHLAGTLNILVGAYILVGPYLRSRRL
jgi:spermidine synthase